ncbi:glutathione S-transferase [PVC group bacterium]|nr:glutathione S-transferase [PVC group bacterium]
MRARMTLLYAGISFEVREIELSHKPASMLEISPKGTVPVLYFCENNKILEESLDIIRWALAQNDPDGWADWSDSVQKDIEALIHRNDIEFKTALDKYKYPDRNPERTQEQYRHDCESIFRDLEGRLEQHRFLIGARISIADISLFPFIRQCANVDLEWFLGSDYRKLIQWLKTFEDSLLYKSIMIKYNPWQSGDIPILVDPIRR